jgi:hypothetical protein
LLRVFHRRSKRSQIINAEVSIGRNPGDPSGGDAFQVSYVVFWQIIDNRRIFAPVDERFGLFRATGGQVAPTLLSEAFRKKIAGGQVTNYT